MEKERIKIGLNKSLGSNCIIIGQGLKTKKDYHLLINHNGVKIDKIMTLQEYYIVSQLLVALEVVN